MANSLFPIDGSKDHVFSRFEASYSINFLAEDVELKFRDIMTHTVSLVESMTQRLLLSIHSTTKYVGINKMSSSSSRQNLRRNKFTTSYGLKIAILVLTW